MAKLISEREVVSVRLLTMEFSEDDLAVYVGAINYLLSHANEEVIEEWVGAYPGEVAAIRDNLSQWLDEAALDPLNEQLEKEPA